MNLVVLGATGSIGASALDVVDELGERVRVTGLSCHRSWEELARLAGRWRPDAVAVADPEAFGAARAAGAFPSGTDLLGGPEGLVELAGREADSVLNGVVGAAGLPATLAALDSGARVALANKESLVVGGELVMRAAGGRADEPDARLVPVDSEHSAIWRLLQRRPREWVRRIVLTASGGPFRDRDRLADVTPAEALDHPTWSMGPKITIDSATLANKGLEVIEAHHLFGMPYDRIDVVVHPQSVMHGAVELVDGTLFAELGSPDMRAPIHAALTHPERVERASRVRLAELPRLTFEEPDSRRFPSLGLACQAGRTGGTAPAVFNAANEVAVTAFLEARIGFLDIPAVCEAALAAHDVVAADSIETLMQADRWAREWAARRAGLERTPSATWG